MVKNYIDYALCEKIFDSFMNRVEDIRNGLKGLKESYRKNEFLDFKNRELVLDAGYALEAAVYRSIVYNSHLKDSMQNILQTLNSEINSLAMETDHEFLKCFNLKVCALISLYAID